MATATNEVEEIRRRMAQIRHELHEDVKEVVEGAEEVTDWRRYVRLYPWAAVGATTAAGFLVTYLVVPKRREEPREVVQPTEVRVIRESDLEERKRRKSLMGAAFGMLAPLAWRAVQNYAMGYLEQWIAQQQQKYMESFGILHEAASPPPREPGGPSSPSWGGGGGTRRPGGPERPGGPGRPGGPYGAGS